MKNSNRDLVREAVQEAERVKDLAVEAAKKNLVESMAPRIRALVERELKGSVGTEGVNRMRQAAGGYDGITDFEEGAKKGEEEMPKDKDMEEVEESLGAMWPNIAEEEEVEGDLDMEESWMAEADDDLGLESSIPTLGESEDEEEEEEVSIDTEGLKRAYEGLMKMNKNLTSEATVSSGFADTYPQTEWETEDGAPKAPGKGVALKGTEGKGWEETTPPAAQDYSVKEAVEKAMSENAAVRDYIMYLEGKLSESYGLVENLKKEIHEVNLFNSKVMHVNEMLSKFGKKLTAEQKKMCISKIDEGRTVKQVTLIAGALREAFKSAAALTEGNARRPKANSSRSMTSGGANQKVLRESVDNNARNEYARIQKLAGLLK